MPDIKVVRGTSAEFQHGGDITITRSNIELTQSKAVADGKEPYDSEQITKLFIHFPSQRHFNRSKRLMTRYSVKI